LRRHCEERSDEAIQLVCRGEGSWIASRSLSSGAHSRDPLARNDGWLEHQQKRPCRAGALFRVRCPRQSQGTGSLLLEETLELLLEAGDAAAAIHQLLGAAGPGRVRFGVDIEVQLVAGLTPGGTGLVLG